MKTKRYVDENKKICLSSLNVKKTNRKGRYEFGFYHKPVKMNI